MLALTVAVCLALSDAAIAALAVGGPGGQAGALRPSLAAEQMPIRLWIPAETGWIDDAYTAPSYETSNGKHDLAPVIVLVQDAHTNPSAQFNAAHVIDLALRSADTNIVFMEAGQGDLSLEPFRAAGTPESRAAAAAPLVRKGLLQGAEYLHLTSDRTIRLLGAENRAAYERALGLYREVVRHRPAALTAIAKMERALSALGPDAFGPELSRLWKRRGDHRSGSVSTTEYSEFLLERLAARSADTFLFPNLNTLSKLKSREAAIDFESVSRAITRVLPDAGTAEIMAAAPLRGHGDAEADAWAVRAEAAFMNAPDTIDAETRTKVSAYLDYRKACRAFDAMKVMDELGRAEKLLTDSVTSSDPDARRWVWSALAVERLKALVRLEAVPGERGAAAGAEDEVRAVAAELNRRILDLGRFAEAVVLDDAELERTVRMAREFYRLAAVRDRFFVGRTLRTLERSGSGAAVLVTGGYHAPNLRQMLRDRGVSYVSVIPRVEHETDHDRYERLLVSASAIALYPAGARAAFSSDVRKQVGEAFEGLARPTSPTDPSRVEWTFGRDRARTGTDAGSGPGTAGARMSDVLIAGAQSRLRAKLTAPVRPPDADMDQWEQELTAWAGEVREAFDTFRDTLWKNRVWNDPEAQALISRLYSEGAQEVLKALADAALRFAAGDADDDEIRLLRKAAMAITGSAAQGEMRPASNVDAFWVFPDDAVIADPASDLITLRPVFSRLKSFYQKKMHQTVFGDDRTVQHRLKKDQRTAIEAFAVRADLTDPEEYTMINDLGVQVGSMLDAKYVAGSRDAFDDLQRDFFEYLDKPNVPGGDETAARGVIRQMILLRDKEYRDGRMDPLSLIKRGIGGMSEWRLYRQLTELSRRRDAARPVLYRVGAWFRSFWNDQDKVRQAAWRLAALRDAQQTAGIDSLSRNDQIQYLKDATLVFEMNTGLMADLWDSVRYVYANGDSDSEQLEILLAADPDRGSGIPAADLKALRNRSRHDVEIIVAAEEIVPGLSEFAIAWPEDRIGLLQEAAAVLAAHGLDLRTARVRTHKGKPSDHFRVRGLPSDPAERERMIGRIRSDLRDVYAGRIRVEDLFARRGHAYRWRRKPAAPEEERFKTVTWAEGNRIGVFTENMTEPGIFHLMTRFITQRGVSIVSSGRIWTQGDLASNDFVVRHVSGAELTEDEMNDLAGSLREFLDSPEIGAWSFHPALDDALKRLNRALSDGPKTMSLDQAAGVFRGEWLRFSADVWGDDPGREAVSALKDFEARMRVYAEGARRVAGELWARVPDSEKTGWEFAPAGWITEDALTPWQDNYWALMPSQVTDGSVPAPLRIISVIETVFYNGTDQELDPSELKKHLTQLSAFEGAMVPFLDQIGGSSDPGTGVLDRVNAHLRDRTFHTRVRNLESWSQIPEERRRLIERSADALDQDGDPSESRVRAFNRRLMRALHPSIFPGGPQGEHWVVVAGSAEHELDRLTSAGLDDVWNPRIAAGYKAGTDPFDTVARFFLLLNAGGGLSGGAADTYAGTLREGLAARTELRERLGQVLLRQWDGFHQAANRELTISWGWAHSLKYRPMMWVEFMAWIRRAEALSGKRPSPLSNVLREVLLMNHRTNLVNAPAAHRLGWPADYTVLDELLKNALPLDDFLDHPFQAHGSRRPEDAAENWYFMSANRPRLEAYLQAAAASLDLMPQVQSRAAAPATALYSDAAALGLQLVRGVPVLTSDEGPATFPDGPPALHANHAMSKQDLFRSWSDDPDRVMRIFELSAKGGYPLSMSLEQLISEWRASEGNDLTARLSDPTHSSYGSLTAFRKTFDTMMDLEPPIGGALTSMHRTGILQALLPEAGESDLTANLNPYHSHRVLWHSIDVLKGIESSGGEFTRPADSVWKPGLRKSLRWAALLHDLTKPMSRFSIESDEDSVAAYRIVPAAMKRFGHVSGGLVQTLTSWLTIHDLHLAKNVKQISGRAPSEVAHAMLKPWWVDHGTDSRIAGLLRKAFRDNGYGAAEAFAALMIFASADEDSIRSESKFNNMPPIVRTALTEFWNEVRIVQASAPVDGPSDAVRSWVEKSLESLREAIRHQYAQNGFDPDVMEGFLGSDPSIWAILNPRLFIRLHDLFSEAKEPSDGSGLPEIGWLVERNGRYMDVIAVSADGMPELVRRAAKVIFETGGSIQDGQISQVQGPNGPLAYAHVRVVWPAEEAQTSQTDQVRMDPEIADAVRQHKPKSIAAVLDRRSRDPGADDPFTDFAGGEGEFAGPIQILSELTRLVPGPGKKTKAKNVLKVTVETADVRGIFGGLMALIESRGWTLHQASIETLDGRAWDSFWVTRASGGIPSEQDILDFQESVKRMVENASGRAKETDVTSVPSRKDGSVQGGSGQGARMSAVSDPEDRLQPDPGSDARQSAIDPARVAWLAAGIIREHGARLAPGEQLTLPVRDPAGPAEAAARRISVIGLSGSADRKEPVITWNGARMSSEAPKTATGRAPDVPEATQDAWVEFKRQVDSMKPFKAGGPQVRPVVLLLDGLLGAEDDPAREARSHSLIAALIGEKGKLAIELRGSGSNVEYFNGILNADRRNAGRVRFVDAAASPEPPVYYGTRADVSVAKAAAPDPATFWAVTFADQAAEAASEAAGSQADRQGDFFAFHPMLRLAHWLAGRRSLEEGSGDLERAHAYYADITGLGRIGREFGVADFVSLLHAEPDAVKKFASPLIRVPVGQVLQMYSMAARMSERSA